MLIPVDYAQVNWRFAGAAAPTGAEVTLGLNIELFAGTPQEAAEICVNGWEATFLLSQVEEITLTEAVVKFGPNDVGPQGAWPSGNTGDISGLAEVPSAAILVKKETGIGGRQGQGRMFVPGVPGSTFDSSGLMSPGDLSGLQVAAEALLTFIGLEGLVPVLLHSEDSPIAAPFPITAVTVQARAATQRRRLRR